jgi:hypothetical protein
MTGTALLAGATLSEGLGTLILGLALAWLVGSETTSRAYGHIRGLPNRAWAWTRVLTLMSIGGCVLAAVAAWSSFNSFVVCGATALFGTAMSPFAQVPTQRRWLKWLVWVVALVVFFFSSVGTSMLSDTASRNAERVGELCVYGLIALWIGVVWLVEGWRLVVAGVSLQQPVSDSHAEPIRDQRGTKWLYVSLFAGRVPRSLRFVRKGRVTAQRCLFTFYATTDTSPCCLRVGRTTISTSCPSAMRNSMSRSTEKALVPYSLEESAGTCGGVFRGWVS